MQDLGLGFLGQKTQGSLVFAASESGDPRGQRHSWGPLLNSVHMEGQHCRTSVEQQATEGLGGPGESACTDILLPRCSLSASPVLAGGLVKAICLPSHPQLSAAFSDSRIIPERPSPVSPRSADWWS